jgi:hypothetical protein
MSGALDIVVEFPFLPSFPAPGGDERLYLAESVALAIEVKSDLCAQDARSIGAAGLFTFCTETAALLAKHLSVCPDFRGYRPRL